MRKRHLLLFLALVLLGLWIGVRLAREYQPYQPQPPTPPERGLTR